MRVGRVAWQIGSVGGLVGFGLVLGFCFRGICGWVGYRGSGSCWSFHLLLVRVCSPGDGAWVDFGFPLVPRLTCVGFPVAGPWLGPLSAGLFPCILLSVRWPILHFAGVLPPCDFWAF